MVDRLVYLLKAEEGFRPCAYRDSLGHLTIGHGILIEPPGGITEAESEYLLRNRVQLIVDDLARHGWGEDFLILMAYQMGVKGVLGFRKMLQALRGGDREKAAQEALDSRWARQTPLRAQRIATMIREG